MNTCPVISEDGPCTNPVGEHGITLHQKKPDGSVVTQRQGICDDHHELLRDSIPATGASDAE